MNRLQELWGRLGNTERLVIAVGVPLVALAAIWSSHNAKGKKAAADPEAAPVPTGAPQQFGTQPWDLVNMLDPILKRLEQVPKAVGTEVDKIPKTIEVKVPPAPEVPKPPVPATTGPLPTDHYPGQNNVTVAQTGNDLFYKDPAGLNYFALVDTLAYRVHTGATWLGDAIFYESQNGAGVPLAIRGSVAQRLAAVGW